MVGTPALPRRSAKRRRARTRPRRTHWSGCRACPSAACNRSALRLPSGRKRGSRKQVSPPGACASTRKASHMGADMNHLWPVSAYSSPAAMTARVVLARTSLPPCFSVMPMPKVTDVLVPERDEAGIVAARADLRQPLGQPLGIGRESRRPMRASSSAGRYGRPPRPRWQTAWRRAPPSDGARRMLDRRVPGRRVEAVLHARRHEGVIGGVKFDLVDPVAGGVEAAQARRILVGEAAEIEAIGPCPSARRTPPGPRHRDRRHSPRAHREAGRLVVTD